MEKTNIKVAINLYTVDTDHALLCLGVVKYRLTIPAFLWISNHIHYKIWDEITYSLIQYVKSVMTFNISDTIQITPTAMNTIHVESDGVPSNL